MSWKFKTFLWGYAFFFLLTITSIGLSWVVYGNPDHTYNLLFIACGIFGCIAFVRSETKGE